MNHNMPHSSMCVVVCCSVLQFDAVRCCVRIVKVARNMLYLSRPSLQISHQLQNNLLQETNQMEDPLRR